MRIYVGNMPYSMTEDELRDLFVEHGEVSSVAIINDRQTGRPRGFGFVEMETEDAGEKAIEALNSQEVGGRQLVVNKARPRQNRGGGGRRQGGYNQGDRDNRGNQRSDDDMGGSGNQY